MNHPGMDAVVTPATACVNAAETRRTYLEHAARHACRACLRHDCPACATLLLLIDARGTECDARGCTLARCVYDPP